jgi:phosphoglycerate dehydrogenase-like enzyme
MLDFDPSAYLHGKHWSKGQMAKCIILGESAPRYREHFGHAFPTITFETAVNSIELDAATLAQMHDARVLWAPPSQVTETLLRAMSSLQWIQALAAGIDPLLALKPLLTGKIVTTLSGIHAPQMAELAFLLMMALQRRFREMVQNQASCIWRNWNQPILTGKTLIVVGLGAAGQHVAKLARVFGMNVIAVSDACVRARNITKIYPRRELATAVRQADFVLVLVPLSTETRNLISAHILSQMPRHAFLINLARGGVVDEGALIAALLEGRIAGAGLDVFVKEPLSADSALWGLPNVVITPHIGGFSDVLFEQSLPVLMQNLERFQSGRVGLMRNRRKLTA